MDPSDIAIAGAGIGGLTTALALSQRGVGSCVLEARAELSEAGAGIQLGPNATRILLDLGVLQAVVDTASEPEAIIARDGATGEVLSRLPLGSSMRERFGVPYLVCHRADLQNALSVAAMARPDVTFEMDSRVTDVTSNASGGVTLQLAQGRTLQARGVIAADGIWSALRRTVAPGWSFGESKRTAARTLVPREIAPAPMAENAVGTWLSPHGHVVHYPVRNGNEIAIVVITRRGELTPGWGHDIAAELVRTDIARIARALDASFASGLNWRQWSLYDPEPLGLIHDGPTCLVGDAAHPILPFLAQGGAMAIEDAAVLAHEVARHPADLARAFAAYAEKRQPRTRRLQAASRQNGQIFHLSGPMALARNLAMRVIPPERLMARYDWLYGWRLDL